MLRILIADDHSIVRKGLRQILQEEFEDAFIDEAGTGEELLNMVLNSEWDIVISDIAMPGRSGLDVLQQIKPIRPKLPVLMLSIHSEDHYAIRVLKAGAAGYLKKDLAPEELVNAVKTVTAGKKYITAAVAEKLVAQFGHQGISHEDLSDREFEVLKLLAGGKSVSEIAELLSLSATTVSTYKTRIMTKLQLKTNAEFIRYAVEKKLI